METLSRNQAFQIARWVLRNEEDCELAEEVLDTEKLMEEFEHLMRYYRQDSYSLTQRTVRKKERKLRESVTEFMYSEDFQLEQLEAPKVTL